MYLKKQTHCFAWKSFDVSEAEGVSSFIGAACRRDGNHFQTFALLSAMVLMQTPTPLTPAFACQREILNVKFFHESDLFASLFLFFPG